MTVTEKAQRLVDDDGVWIIYQDSCVIEGRGFKDGGLYHIFVYANGTFYCSCDWGKKHAYTTDLCAHALAIKLAVEREVGNV